MTVAVDLVVARVTEPVRFIYETKARIFPQNDRFWNINKPRIHDLYIMELKKEVLYLVKTNSGWLLECLALGDKKL